MKKIKIADESIPVRDWKAADWIRISSGNPTSWRRDEWSGCIVAAPEDDENWWDGIEAKVQGHAVRLIEDSADEGHIYFDGQEIRSAQIGAENRYAYELAALAGYEIGGKMQLDIEEAADSFIEEHPGFRYVMNNDRGFANEWMLYACASSEEAAEIKRIFVDTSEYNAESVRHWMIDAMAADEEYARKHGSKKLCGMKFAPDADNYGVALDEDN